MNIFLDFLRHPRYFRSSEIDWKDFMQLYLYLVLIILIISPLLYLTKKYVDITEISLGYSAFSNFLLYILVAPVLEEIAFRLILKPTAGNIYFYALFCLSVFIAALLTHKFFLMIISLLIFLILMKISLHKRNIRRTQQLIIRNYFFFFYLTCLLFSVLHLLNYTHVCGRLLMVAPILILPQLISSGFLGFVRIKFGIIFAIIFHMLINLIPSLFVLNS